MRYIEKSYIMKITDEKSKPWVTLGSEYLVRRPWLTARRDCVRLANGVVNDEYYVLEYPDWVNVIAITTDGKFVMIYWCPLKLFIELCNKEFSSKSA